MFLAFRVLGFVLVETLAGWLSLSYQVWTALKSGRAKLRREVIRRTTQPLYCWLVVSVWTGFALNFFVARAGALAREVWSAAA